MASSRDSVDTNDTYMYHGALLRLGRVVGAMDANPHTIVEAWQLSVRSHARLQGLAQERIDACCDIDRALVRLLCDRRLIRAWLRRRQPSLFHARPLDIILGSRAGCLQLRALLLAEVAATGPDDGIIAAAIRPPS